MKHIKLFEQFDEEEEAWWNEPDPLDQTKLKVIKGGNQYYLLKEIIGEDQIKLFDEDFLYPKHRFKMDPFWDISKDKIVLIIGNDYSWAGYLYKDIPKEIRDRII